MRNNYIVVEGLEGAGKTTISRVIFNILKDLGMKKVILTREPGGTFLAEKIRNLLLNVEFNNSELINDKTEVLLLYAARVQLIESIVKPALENGNWVISDRHDLSTQAYQGGGNGFNKRTLEILRNIVLGNFRPGMTLYLDVTPEVGFSRMYNRSKLDRFEKKPIIFFSRVRDCYMKLAEEDASIQTIDANRPLKEVIQTVRETIVQQFQEKQ